MRKSIIIYGFIILLALTAKLFADIGADDPGRLSLGARALGMGKMFVPVADDASALFNNPAGIAGTRQLQLMTMASQLLWAVDYRTIGMIVPVDSQSAVGIGYAARTIPEIALYPYSASVNGRVDRTAVDYASFSDSVLILSYARQVELFDIRNLKLGGNLKYFKKEGLGSTALAEASARGVNFDLGLLWNVKDNINIGLAVNNLLRPIKTNDTGVLKWDTGAEEYFDTIYKIGVSNKYFSKKVLAGFEFEKNSSQPNYPGIGHLGLEWRPVRYLALRGGIDQSFAMPDIDSSARYNIYNNLTFGIGLNYNGWAIDYAYCFQNDLAHLNTHYVSISLIDLTEEETAFIPELTDEVAVESKVVKKSTEEIIVTAPEDRLVTYSANIIVYGEVHNSKNKIIRINGEDYTLTEDDKFSLASTLGIGYNDIIIFVPEFRTKVLRRVLRLISFADIDDIDGKLPLESMAVLGYVSEDDDGFFNPGREVSRAELAKMLVKIKRLKAPATLNGIWEDTDLVANEGLMQGFPNGLFLQTGKLTRSQLAVVLARFMQLPFPETIQLSRASYLAREHWAEPAVQALVNTGLYKAEEFLPYSKTVTKKEMVLAFYRSPLVQQKVENLFNFVEEEPTDKIVEAKKQTTLFIKDLETKNDQDEIKLFETILNNGEKTAVQEIKESNRQDSSRQISALDVEIFQAIMETPDTLPEKTIKAPIELWSIEDKTIVYSAKLVLRGKVLEKAQLYINEQQVFIKDDGKYFYKVDLQGFGKHLVKIKIIDKNGKQYQKNIRLLYLPKINDILANSSHKKAVVGLVALGYFDLETGDNFKIDKKVRAEEWAKILNKLSAGEFSYKNTFGETKALEVSRTRAGMSLAMLLKLEVSPYAGKTDFKDISAKQTYAKYINALKAKGIVSGLTYKPDNALTRLAGAQLLAKVPALQSKIADLYNWENGY